MTVEIMPFVGHSDSVLRSTVTTQVETTRALPRQQETIIIHYNAVGPVDGSHFNVVS